MVLELFFQNTGVPSPEAQMFPLSFPEKEESEKNGCMAKPQDAIFKAQRI